MHYACPLTHRNAAHRGALTIALIDFIARHHRLLVLTGAGVSTGSGIPDYRDENGDWKQGELIYYQDFVRSRYARQRYWARSAIGWPRFSAARPGRAHHALAELESMGKISSLITQNVDRLHQHAGSQQVVDLHGTLERVVCLGCNERSSRDDIQSYLLQQNQQLDENNARPAPDGDALLENIDFFTVEIPVCEHCGGMLKPDVVFFGENVPAERVQNCYASLEQADAMLVVGSSLMVYSGYRFVRRAHELGLPIAAVNRGITRADDLLSVKIEQDCGDVLVDALAGLTHR